MQKRIIISVFGKKKKRKCHSKKRQKKRRGIFSPTKKNEFFFPFREEKKRMGWARASRPVPGLVALKYFPPLEAATAADLA